MALASKITWKLTPIPLQDYPFKDPDRTRLEQLYRDCHLAVFDKEPDDSLTRWPDHTNLLEQGTRFGTSVQTFITTVMLAHHLTAPDRPFFARELLTETAVNRFERYRTACCEQFGHFDISTLETQFGRHFIFIKDTMARSEQLFAEWLVGFGKITNGDDCLSTIKRKEVFRIREEAYNPVWLATEPLYMSVLMEHLKADVDLSNATLGLRRHRHGVVQALRQLKKSPSIATYVFSQRESVMADTYVKVLKLHNFTDADFDEHDLFNEDEAVVGNASFFWVLVGQMIRRRLIETIPGIEAQLKYHGIARA